MSEAVKPIVLNQVGAEFGRALAARAPGVEISDAFDPARPWATAPGVTALVTRPTSGWTNAPREKPCDWPGDLKWVQLASTGIDFYPDWLVTADGPIVTCARGVTGPAIAEYVFAAMLDFEKRLEKVAIRSPAGFRQVELGALEGRALGLYGFGAIGRALAVRARAFEMEVVATRRDLQAPAEDGVRYVPDLAALVGQCDHLVLVTPLTAETRQALNADVLAKARPGLHIVNPARGGLVDQQALLAALDDGRIAAATLDATDPEPLPEGHPFYTHPHVRITPHISWQSPRNARKLVERTALNLEAFLAGAPFVGLVDALKRY